jgi:hypothetical protein
MPPRKKVHGPAPRWRSVLFAGLVVVLGALLATLGAFAAGGTAVHCTRSTAGSVTCVAESTRWLGRSSMGHDPIGSILGVSSRVAERSERDPDARGATSTTRRRADWYLVLDRVKAKPWELAGTREQVETATGRLRGLLDDPARHDETVSVDDWGFGWAAMVVGVLFVLGGARMLASVR